MIARLEEELVVERSTRGGEVATLAADDADGALPALSPLPNVDGGLAALSEGENAVAEKEEQASQAEVAFRLSQTKMHQVGAAPKPCNARCNGRCTDEDAPGGRRPHRQVAC